MQDATRQGKILSFFPNEKERKFARNRGGGEKERGGGLEGGGLTFFKGIINSLSALVVYAFVTYTLDNVTIYFLKSYKMSNIYLH